MRMRFLVATVLAASGCGKTITVHTVSSGSGAPVEGYPVQVDDQSWVTTGAEGTATFDGVSEPFTVRVRDTFTSPSSDDDAIRELRQQTGSEVFVEVGDRTLHQAWVSGNVTGRSGPSSSAVDVAVAYTQSQSNTTASSDGSFMEDVEWDGDGAAGFKTLRGWESDGGHPAGHYFGFGSTTVPIVDNQRTTGVSLSLGPVTEGTVAGTVSIPAALASEEPFAELLLVFGPHERLSLGSTALVGGGFGFVVPEVADAEPRVRVAAGTHGWHERRVAVPSSGLALDIPAPPDVVEPADGATIGTDSVFRWSPAPGGRSRLLVSCDFGITNVSWVVETDGGDATLPSIPNRAVPSGAACWWVVRWCATTDTEERCAASYARMATW